MSQFASNQLLKQAVALLQALSGEPLQELCPVRKAVWEPNLAAELALVAQKYREEVFANVAGPVD